MNTPASENRKTPAGWRVRLREASGFVLISVGVTGLLVPIIPGIPLIAAGVGVLGSDHSFVRRWRTKLEEKGVLKAQQGKIPAPLDGPGPS